ncbi:glyoxalase/bleomycin resistance protein/dioxygenase [Streptomyces sp. CBMAI 2042]|nr:glyoxalase/bleomycin resistance protein/dioxygenase [Streptomyces sp. CBMAI 2042]
MPITTVAPPVRGAPCWVNLLVRDLSAAQAFYSAVLGWTFDSSGMLGNGFSIALADGRTDGRSPVSEPDPRSWPRRRCGCRTSRPPM